METLVVNLFGAPSTGKSTIAYGLMYQLKILGIECEFASEYAKDLVFDGDMSVFENQKEIYQEQKRRLLRYVNKVSVVITDSPLPLFIYYDKTNDIEFKNIIVEEFLNFNNLNFFLIRNHQYNPNGRYQNEKEAEEVHEGILQILNNNSISYFEFKSGLESLDLICDKIIQKLKL